MKHFILVLLVILAASQRAALSQCTDSSTVSQINLYLLKGAEARERLNVCREYRRTDSVVIVQQRAALQATEQHHKKQLTTYRAVCIALAVLLILAL